MEELPEHLVHELLEDGGGVGKAIRHHEVLIVAGGSNECRLPLVALPDSNEVVRAAQVQLREDAGPTEFLKRGRDQGNVDRGASQSGSLELGSQYTASSPRPSYP